MRRHLIGLSLIVACLLGTAVRAQENDPDAGKLLYQDNCSICHGLMASDARYYFPGESLWQRVQVGMLPSVASQWAVLSGRGVSVSHRRAMRSPSAPVSTTDDAR